MSKFKLTQTATEVQDILNNSLQKPTGLTKTKLVGVGVNGQENIEIGDNLTLANGKLAAAGGGVNGLESDAEGNLTASKNLGVDGKLTLKSLVSASNPDGDIVKYIDASGSSILHCYDVKIKNSNNELYMSFYTTKLLKGFANPGDTQTNKSMYQYKEFFPEKDINIPCSGSALQGSNQYYPVVAIRLDPGSYGAIGGRFPIICTGTGGTTTEGSVIASNNLLQITRRY